MAKQEKQIKDKHLAARIDDAMEAKVLAYIDASDEMNMGILVRQGVLEYMINHPIKTGNAKANVNDVPRPGVA
jgi:hypothetical protein